MLRELARLRFTAEVRAVPGGRVVFAGEPLLEVTAPVAGAARCVLAAAGAQVVGFAFRRTQGVEAGLEVARTSAIAGFSATSNVEAARRTLDRPVRHSRPGLGTAARPAKGPARVTVCGGAYSQTRTVAAARVLVLFPVVVHLTLRSASVCS